MGRSCHERLPKANELAMSPDVLLAMFPVAHVFTRDPGPRGACHQPDRAWLLSLAPRYEDTPMRRGAVPTPGK